MKFSVLMSIYNKENPVYFNKSMQSIWDDQILKPDEIVLVLDGPLNDELDEIIEVWKEKLGCVFKVISIEKNVGLGEALNKGLEQCSYELVARMDTDDIASSDRFEKQLAIFKNEHVDICSSWVSEFDDDEHQLVSYRKLPTSHKDLKSYIKKRNPINHPAVMFKKSMVIDAGGYRHMTGFEDYYLWARMMENGSKFANIPEPLVSMRAGYSQLERRGGFKYAINEVKFQNALYALGAINSLEYSRNVTIRFISRIMPKSILKKIYQVVRTK